MPADAGRLAASETLRMTQFTKGVARVAFFLALALIGWDANGVLGALLMMIVGGVLLNIAMKRK
jgi:uncharacterized membrane protein